MIISVKQFFLPQLFWWGILPMRKDLSYMHVVNSFQNILVNAMDLSYFYTYNLFSHHSIMIKMN